MAESWKSADQTREEVKEILALLLARARKTVRMSTGLTTDLLHDLRPQVEQALARVETFNLLLDKDVERSRLESKYSWLDGYRNVHIHAAKEPVQHITLIDDTDFRVEALHKNPPDRSWVGRENLTVLGDPVAGAVVAMRFNKVFDEGDVIKT